MAGTCPSRYTRELRVFRLCRVGERHRGLVPARLVAFSPKTKFVPWLLRVRAIGLWHSMVSMVTV